MPALPNAKTGLGRKPALLIVDATVGFTDPASPLGCESSAELAMIAKLIAAFRARKLPIVYTTHSYRHPSEAPVFRAKLPLNNSLVAGSAETRVNPRIAPSQDDIIVNKTVPSAFFDSPLRQMLRNLDVDSTVVCGFSTSGCVRASAVDAMQCDFRVVVARDACGDRDLEAHHANLRDIDLKYGDVVDVAAVLAMLEHQPASAT